MNLWKPRLLLLLLLVAIGSVELRWAGTSLRYIHSPQSFPRDLAGGFDPQTFKIEKPTQFAREQGLRDGDVLVAIDGVRVSSYADALRRSLSRAPGSTINCRVRREGVGLLDIPITLAPHESESWQSSIIPLVLNILTPLCCTGLGFLVALRRPRDPVALALLLLLLSLSFMMSANGSLRSTYPPLFTWAIAFLNNWAGRAVSDLL